MNDNFTPNMGTYTNLTPFRFWCQKVLPLTYDNSLSYYELLCKVVDYLNKTMEDVDTVIDDTEKLYDAFDEYQEAVNTSVTNLESYVDDYFENLDVQTEIDAKLDEMAEDGTLDTLLLPYFNSYKSDINTIVSSQNESIAVLESRMDSFTQLPNGSTSGDAELADIRISVTGETYPTAGDAVRGQIDLVTERILDPYNVGLDAVFTDGYRIAYNTGNRESNNDWAASDYIDISGINTIIYTQICINTTQTITTGMAFYDTDKTYISGSIAEKRTGGGMTYQTLEVPEGAVYARFTYYKSTSVYQSSRPFRLYDYSKLVKWIEEEASSRVNCSVIPGTMLTGSGAEAFSKDSYYTYRKLSKLIKVSSEPVLIQVSDGSEFSSMGILKYKKVDGVITFSEYVGLNHFVGNNFLYIKSTWDDAEYIKLTLTPVESSSKQYPDVSFVSTGELKVVKNTNIPNPSYGHITFAYELSNGVYTSGQLRLPPNYTEDGAPVPLYVNVHGTGAYDTWTRKMGTSSETDSYYLLEYMANEGFAVFDCYPWTSKYYSANAQISPIATPTNEFAYIEGIKFICENFNVDINNVCMMFKSLGGHLGYWTMVQSYIKPKAIAMLAPSTGFASTIWGRYFIQQNLRNNVVKVLGLENEENADIFISTDRGMENTAVVEFVEDHLDQFFKFNPAIYGVNGATYKEQYDWMVTGETDEPQWMIDLNIPAWPSAWQTSHGIGVPALVNHPELSKRSMYPVKYWQAFDDVNTSAHANYTIYNWLKNGGSDVEWRTLPNGTGGHHAIDTSDNALKSSGTTRLGISYSDIATTYVEMADFFYEKMN